MNSATEPWREGAHCYGEYGFNVTLYGYMDVWSVSMHQRILRPIKFLASKARIIPGSTQGKKWLKRIVFGGLVRLPVEIGPQITQITQIEKDEGTLYRGCYVEPDRISSDEANTSYKVIYCAASLE